MIPTREGRLIMIRRGRVRLEGYFAFIIEGRRFISEPQQWGKTPTSFKGKKGKGQLSAGKRKAREG